MPKTIPTPSIKTILAPGGRLSNTLPGYEHRVEQLDACQTIDRALREGKIALVEAGTGVGKSLAYLIPAVRAAADGKTTVIATHTIGLQSQLITKDIPLVAQLFPEIKVNAVLMKGRGNYLCKQDLDGAESDIFHAMDPLFKRLKAWARVSDTGDVADLPFSYPHWYEMAANPDTCRGKDCRYYDRCFYYRMRREAADANIIVVNHALFFTDLVLRAADPKNGILPEYNAVIFDEAHHLEDVATDILGIEIGNRDVPMLLDRLRRVKALELDQNRLERIETLNEQLFAPFHARRYEFFFHDVLVGDLQTQAEELVKKICLALAETEAEMRGQGDAGDEIFKERLQGLLGITTRLREGVHAMFFSKNDRYIRWGEQATATPGTGFRRKAGPRVTLHHTPIEVGSLLHSALWSHGISAVLTSATLANSGGFSYIRSRLGLPEDCIEKVAGSPFDFKTQALLYVPGHMPAPPKAPSSDYVERVAAEMERIVTLTEGRAFLLFTSRRMLGEVYEILKERLDMPLFKQGDKPPGKLLDEFRASGNGCLFGNQTFWEGVDVRGEALSCVVIDRIPFGVPDSPITRSRCEAVTAAGGDWFRDYSIPQAQIRLKQGFGRLIRTHTDRGMVCILDSRILTRDYGAEFVRHLPPATRASLWKRVERFWLGIAPTS